MDRYNNDQHVFLSRKAQSIIMTDLLERRSIEACGVLLGSIDDADNWLVESVSPLPNIFNSPVYFEFDPQDLLHIELAYPGKIIGVYHSHPTGFPRASDTDRQNMQRVNGDERIPWVWLIICGPFDKKTQQCLSTTNLVAYHHFDRDGLQKIELRLAELSSESLSET